VAAEEVAFLLQLVGGDRAAAREILSFFLESDVKDRAALTQAVAAKDVVAIRHHAHRIKGASRAIGAGAHAAHALAIELASDSGIDFTGPVAVLEESARQVAAWTWELQ
jgi:HPt (histidine-containing phosphotransfer) domain-containing protein